MRTAILLALLFLPSISLARVKYEWTIEATNYYVEVTKPLKDLPYGGSLGMTVGRERGFGMLADAGYPLFMRLRNEQASTIWLQCKIEDHGPCCAYDGALAWLSLVDSSGDTLRVTQLLCSSVKGLDEPMTPRLTEVYAGMPWDHALFASRTRTAWVFFAGFPRTVDPGKIRGVFLSKGVEPCAR